MMNYRNLIFLLIINICSCKITERQKINNNCNKTINESIWTPYDKKDFKFDSLKEIYLIFEIDFNDTVSVVVNNIEKKRIFIKTNKSLSAVETPVKVDIPENKFNIELNLIKANDCVKFIPKEKYKYLFIQRTPEGNWFVQYSNYMREYH